MAIEISTQYFAKSRGPFDSKMLVNKYSELLIESTFQSTNGNSYAYNGMIVGVGLDTAELNGVYYLYDPQCNTKFKTPDTTKAENWYKMVAESDLESSIFTAGNKDGLPLIGSVNKLYVVVDENTTYRWDESTSAYVALTTPKQEIEIKRIYGGSAT